MDIYIIEVNYRADEWNVNKWAWEGTLKVVSKGEECIIKLEDKSTGEVDFVYFVLRIEENIGENYVASSSKFDRSGRLRHAFIGIGFRERTQAYDFQAALHDHMKYLNKKKTAEEMEQQFQNTSSGDYSLKEGETIHIEIKNKSGGRVKSKFFEQGMNSLSLEDKGDGKEPKICIKPPPPPPAPLSPASTVQKSPSNLPPNLSLEEASKDDRPRFNQRRLRKAAFLGKSKYTRYSRGGFWRFSSCRVK
ncbi:hypothetical protein Patl1_02418 [Pistacia atlantica]|uniref:Uncharacterized protein n=1 Tax=Pistacia atlantica TaxID=434234 RepID=A0ACC1C6N3_9ROSI|nr:hypothetical protein Patl1_02418 [Pistacia atlantica]